MGKRKNYPKRYRISLDSNACIGCLACTRCKFFEVRKDMRAHAVMTEVDDLGCCREVADACPVGAIVINVLSIRRGRRSMEIKTVPVPVGGKTAQGLMVSWDGGQFVMVIAEKGLVSCGVVDKAVMERFDAAVAIARGTPDKPLRNVEDLLGARIADVTQKASSKFGIQAGMRGEEALKKLCG